MWKYLVSSLILALCGVGAFVWTQSLPEEHHLARSGRFKGVNTELMTATAFDIAGSVAWRTDLRALERQPDNYGREVWRETWPDGTVVTLETVNTVGDTRRTRCVVDQLGPFGGCWEVQVTARDKTDSVVEVKENLHIRSLAWRVLHPRPLRKAAIDRYLRALGEKLGSPPTLADEPRDLNTPIPPREPKAP